MKRSRVTFQIFLWYADLNGYFVRIYNCLVPKHQQILPGIYSSSFTCLRGLTTECTKNTLFHSLSVWTDQVMAEKKSFSPCWLTENSLGLEESVSVITWTNPSGPSSDHLIHQSSCLGSSHGHTPSLAPKFRAMPNSSFHLHSLTKHHFPVDGEGAVFVTPGTAALWGWIPHPGPRGWIYVDSSGCLCCVQTFFCTSLCVIVVVERSKHS